ncbi:glucokinase [Zobellella endophytica]|uniref:Glucokinase n=1 Tax=Zobellella endophytica TaxID=2116700 RepID=A0A2P7RC53_9GAMM|nr:glucokinase [Zobellella endophytica]PSJ47789.1 glucokinase [Zobellella endophytica]
MTSACLIADIGGTNARFALVNEGSLAVRDIRVLQVAAFAGIEPAIRHYLAEMGQPLEGVKRACLAIACPVEQDRIAMTNGGWVFSRQALQRALALSELRVINDYAALAYSIPHLAEHEKVRVGGGEARGGYPIALLGPGTGLGVGGLVGGRPLVTEGGHVDFAPNDEVELAMLRFLWREYPHVSAERLLSGMGLENIYRALCAYHGETAESYSAADIGRHALAGSDQRCVDTVARFFAILGSVAGNLALTMGALGGIYITGGIVPRLLPCLSRSPFRERFEAKGRFHDYMAGIGTWVVVAEQPGLLGAAVALLEREAI